MSKGNLEITDKWVDQEGVRMWIVVAVMICFAFSGVCSAGVEQDMVKSGNFVRIYDPSVGEEKQWYINDHCFVRGKDGTWHMFGITHTEPMDPLDEKNFAHATAKSLTQTPWEKQPFALTADPEHGETHLWAPHVIYHGDTYYMYYCAGDADHAKYKIHLATSKDLWTWTRHPANPMVVDGFDARDPFVMRIGNEWVMYYTATTKPEGGHHIVAYVKSKDLIRWGQRGVAFTDLEDKEGTIGGRTESPFVVRRGDYYYLFIGPSWGYADTDAFRSKDPLHWESKDMVGRIQSHALEVIRDTDSRWYASKCGWKMEGLHLAPLFWNDGLDYPDTSMPAPK